MTRTAKFIGMMVSVALLTGCADAELTQLERTLANIRQSPGGQPPVIAVALPESRTLAYLYSEDRSPFLPPDAIAQDDARALFSAGAAFGRYDAYGGSASRDDCLSRWQCDQRERG